MTASEIIAEMKRRAEGTQENRVCEGIIVNLFDTFDKEGVSKLRFVPKLLTQPYKIPDRTKPSPEPKPTAI